MAQGRKVTIAIPDDAPPGTTLCIPVDGGEEQVKVCVPEGMGPGSTLFLIRPDGAEDWEVEVGEVVPAPPAQEQETAHEHARGSAALSEEEQYHAEELAQRCANSEEQEQALLAQRYAEQERLTQQEERQEQHQQQEQQRQQPQQQRPPQQQAPQSMRPQEEVPAGPKIVRLDTTVGTIDIIVRSDWSPHGACRLMELASSGDLDNLAFYRSIGGCIAQFGLPVKRKWSPVPDDPPSGVPFLHGAVSLAASGENSRKSTIVICAGDMTHCLGKKHWETPIGAVAENTLEVLDRIDSTYGEIAEFGGSGPNVGCINEEGNAYLRREFPRLTYVRSACVLDYQQEHKSHGHLGTDVEDLGPPLVPDKEVYRDAARAPRAAQEATRATQQAALAGPSAKGGFGNGPGSDSCSQQPNPRPYTEPPSDPTARQFWELNRQAQEQAQRQIDDAQREAERKKQEARRVEEERKRQLKQQEQQLEMMKQQAQQQLELQCQQRQMQVQQAKMAQQQAQQQRQQQQQQQEQQLMALKQQAQQQLEHQCQQRNSHGHAIPMQTSQQVIQQVAQQVPQHIPPVQPQLQPLQQGGSMQFSVARGGGSLTFSTVQPTAGAPVNVVLPPAAQAAHQMAQQQSPQQVVQQIGQQPVPQHIPPVRPQLQPTQQGGSLQFSVANGGGSLTFSSVQPTAAPVNVVLPPAAQAAHMAQIQLGAVGCGQMVGQSMGAAGIPCR